MENNRLIVISGPTGVGKTAAAIRVAQALHTEIISADSRQIFREIPIGTAAPTENEMGGVPHHMVAVADPAASFCGIQERDRLLQCGAIRERCA